MFNRASVSHNNFVVINTMEVVRGPVYLTFYLDDAEKISF